MKSNKFPDHSKPFKSASGFALLYATYKLNTELVKENEACKTRSGIDPPSSGPSPLRAKG